MGTPHSTGGSDRSDFLVMRFCARGKGEVEGVGACDEGEGKGGQDARLGGHGCLVGKDTECVKDAVRCNADEQALGSEIHHHEQETRRSGVYDLKQIGEKFGTRAVYQIDDMPDPERHAGDDDSGFDVVLPHRLKE